MYGVRNREYFMRQTRHSPPPRNFEHKSMVTVWQKSPERHEKDKKMVEHSGFEPLTLTLPV